MTQPNETMKPCRSGIDGQLYMLTEQEHADGHIRRPERMVLKSRPGGGWSPLMERCAFEGNVYDY